jgi:hypothetical protein
LRAILDENLPEGLVEPLRRLGHPVERVSVVLTTIATARS